MLTFLIYILFIINVYHSILNPFGQIGSIPVKMAILILLTICLCIGIIFHLIKNRIKIYKCQALAFGILCFCTAYLFVMNFLIGLAKGNNTDYILDNINGYIFAFVIALSIWFLVEKGIRISKLINHFIVATTIVSIFSIVIVITYLFIPSLYINLVDLVFQYRMGSVLPYQGFIRVFLKSQLYSLTIAIFLLIRCIKIKNYNKRDISLVIVNLIPPFLSFTRSFWIAFVIIFAFFYLLDNKLGRFSIRKVTFGIVTCIILCGFFSLPIVKDRLSTSFSIQEGGNIKRSEQIVFTKEYLSKDILFGIGAGGVYFNETFAIESTYNDALARYGVVGFSFLIILIIYPLVIFISRYRRFRKNPPSIDYFFIGYYVIVLVSVTNPFLLSSLGMLYLGFLYGIMMTSQYQFAKIR